MPQIRQIENGTLISVDNAASSDSFACRPAAAARFKGNCITYRLRACSNGKYGTSQ